MAADGQKLVDRGMLESKLTQKLRQFKECSPSKTISTKGKGAVTHMFPVVMDGAEELGRVHFGVATEDGRILVYDTKGDRIVWEHQIDTEQVNWAGVLSGKLRGRLTFLVHSRLSGLHSARKINNGKLMPKALFYESHGSSCKPLLCSDGDILLPVGMSKLMVKSRRAPTAVFKVYTFPAPIMAMKEVEQGDSSKQILVTAEDGSVNLLDVKWSSKKERMQATLLSSLILPSYDLKQQPVGICVDGRDRYYVIGTASRYIYLLHWAEEGGLSRLNVFGRRILTKDGGVSCLAMREGRGSSIIAAGCCDGTIHIFNFDGMIRISTMKYHQSQISALMFVNEMTSHNGRKYLLSSSADKPDISVWSIPNERYLRQSEKVLMAPYFSFINPV